MRQMAEAKEPTRKEREKLKADKERRKKERRQALRLSHDEALSWHAKAMDRGARCEECPLFGYRAGPVMPELRSHATLTIITESPDAKEVDAHQLLQDEHGRAVERALLQGNVDREDCSITEAILCQPPEDYKAFTYRLNLKYKLDKASWVEACERLGEIEERTGEVQVYPEEPKAPKYPAECCSARLSKDIEDSGAPAILALGGGALKACADHFGVPYGAAKAKAGGLRIASFKKQVGAPILIPDGPTIVTTFHPRAVSRPGYRHYLSTAQKHIARAANIARRGGKIDWVEPDYVLNPSPQAIREVLERIGNYAQDRVTIDIETTKGTRSDGKFDLRTCQLKCIGIGAYIDGAEVIICIPIRSVAQGHPYWWDRETMAYVGGLIRDFFRKLRLRGVKLQGHNLAFDTLVLLRGGLLEDRREVWADTLLMHHDSQGNDHPHDLGFVAAEYFEVPAWKGMADDKYFDSLSDVDEWTYNCKDVLTTMRLGVALWKDVVKSGGVSQFKTDSNMAPAYRDMGDLGLVVDEKMRGQLSLFAHEKVRTLKSTLQKLVGLQGFSPNSGPQIRKFLFKEKGLMPVINTKGKDWSEGEDPATNAQSLLRLKAEQPLDETTRSFIETLMEFRGYDKLRGTYIDNLEVSQCDWAAYGHSVPSVPAVEVPIYTEYTKTERKKLLASATSLAEGLDSLDTFGRDVVTGVLPERSALSRLFTVYKIHVIPSGRASTAPACFDDKTQVLTRRGWLLFSELLPTDEVAQFDATTREVSFVLPTSYVSYPFKGSMVHFHNDVIDAVVTPDHRMISYSRAGKIYESRADAVANDRRIPVAGHWRGGTQSYTAWQITLIAAAQADGYINGCGHWEFSFTKERKIERLRAALDQAGSAYTERPKQNGIYTQTRFVVKDQSLDFVTALLGEHKEYGPWVLGLTYASLSALREELYYWDGCVTRMNHYSTSDRASADWALVMHTLTGQRAKIRKYENEHTTRPNWQIDRVEERDYVCTEAKMKHQADYEGMVYCVRVPSTFLVVRREDKPFIAGNCQNWPSSGKINMRKMITVPPGHVLVGADFDQIELRLYAIIARDKLLLEAFAGFIDGVKIDPHSWNAASLFAKGSSRAAVEAEYRNIVYAYKKYIEEAKALVRAELGREATKEEYEGPTYNKGAKEKKKKRNIAKTFTYLELYGGEPDKLFEYMSTARDKATGVLLFPGITMEQVEHWHKMWHTAHPETAAFQRAMQECARLEGFTMSPILDYRKRWFMGGPNKPGATFNHVVQSSASAIANRAVMLIAQKIPYRSWSPFTGLCLQVHDYIGVYVPEERAEEAKKIIEESMIFEYDGMQFTASAKISTTWAGQD